MSNCPLELVNELEGREKGVLLRVELVLGAPRLGTDRTLDVALDDRLVPGSGMLMEGSDKLVLCITGSNEEML